MFLLFASNFGCETKLFFFNLAFFTEPLSSWVNHNEKSIQQTLSFCHPMDRPLDKITPKTHHLCLNIDIIHPLRMSKFLVLSFMCLSGRQRLHLHSGRFCRWLVSRVIIKTSNKIKMIILLCKCSCHPAA